MIKAEDISDEILDRWLATSASGSARVYIAEIANILIDAGVVSPPVYTVRDKAGNLLDDDVYGLYATPEAAESKHADGYTAEHWKG